MTNRQTIEIACDIVGVKPPHFTQPRWSIPLAALALDLVAAIIGPKLPLSGQQMRLTREFIWFDSSKAQRELGLPASRTPIRQALQECYDWYKANGHL